MRTAETHPKPHHDQPPRLSWRREGGTGAFGGFLALQWGMDGVGGSLSQGSFVVLVMPG